MTTQGASSSSSGFTHSWKYDVFLNFRGTDTRNNFTGQLYNYLTDKGIKTFMDDELSKGQEISQSLLTAIEGSRISVVVFSQNYASSKWCLDELVKILQCKESRHQLVLPIFYKVEPADVRNQRGSFAEALAHHECKFKDNLDKVLRWRTALAHAANLSGWTFSKGSESKFIPEIVKEITAHVYKRTHLDVAKYAVGIESRVQDVLKLLDLGECDVRVVGIWGTGGIGKTTIAKAVYNSIAHEFEFGCFLANVREESIPYGGLVNLQNILLSKIPGGKDVKVTNVDEGITFIKELLSHKRVLLILDDVNQLNQLKNLAGGHDWFGLKSRVIITARDIHLLYSHHINLTYKVKKLCLKEAFKLFISWNGQLANRELVDYENCSDQVTRELQSVVHYAQGLPLALTVLGSLLCGRSIDEWQDVLDSYKKVPNKEIQGVLKISFEDLEDPVKEIFLDIACFFKGKKTEYVMQALDGSDLNPKFAIKVLVEKALINIDKNERIWMHDLIEEMGKEIIRQESPGQPGERSRLWFHEDVYDVLTENTGTNKIKGMIVKFPKASKISLSAKCFKKMKNLQLFINVNARFSGEVHYLPNQLKFVDWPGCPVRSLSNFNPRRLVTLNLPRSQISRFGGGLKSFQHLKSMNLEGCESLTEVPNLSGMFPSLETLSLCYCTSLVELHPSVGSLEKLDYMNLEGCCNLTMFPRIDNSTNLGGINLWGCTSLDHFPEIEEKVESLTTLILSHSGIKELPSSINNLISLEVLRVEGCESLAQFPQSIYDLQQLQVFFLYDCPKIVISTNKMNSGVLPTNPNVADDKYGSIPESEDEASLRLPNLRRFIAGDSNLPDTDFLVSLDCVSTLGILNLSGNIFESLPCITKFVRLKVLILDGCKRLREILGLPPNLTTLKARDCLSLERIANLSNILEQKESKMIDNMDLTNCRKLSDSLAEDVEKMKSRLLINEATLLSLCLSPIQSTFQVLFPASDVPEWFSCQMDFTAGFPFYEFSIDILPHLQLEKTGLAVCVAVEKPQSDDRYECSFKVRFSFNHRLWPDTVFGEIDTAVSAHALMYYYPFTNLRPLLEFIPLPFTFRVTIESPVANDWHYCPIKSCGVHLVMPPNEDVSIKISKAHILTLPQPPPRGNPDPEDLEDGQGFTWSEDDEDEYMLSQDDEDEYMLSQDDEDPL